MNIDKLREILTTFPDKPGIYKYYDEQDVVIYVGKAKSLRKRVLSYLNLDAQTPKTRVLVKNIKRATYVVVENSYQALLLENNLIKELQPRYNIQLKDGKTYPSICITNEEFPRVFKTREIDKTKGSFFGPYSSVYTIKTILDYIRETYKVRSCKLPLSEQTIAQNRYRECLDYHIKKCHAPCIGLQSKEAYNREIDEIRRIIKGDAHQISRELLKEMKELSENRAYEKAHEVKIKYELLENFKSKSIISNSILTETDVFAYQETEKQAFINITRVRNGSIIQSHTVEYRNIADEQKTDILSTAIVDLREKFQSLSKEIVIPFRVSYEIEGVKYIIPQKGDRKKILDIANLNAKQYKIERLRIIEKKNPSLKQTELLNRLKDKLKLDTLPNHIETFDISHTGSSEIVGVCVVYKKGKKSKKEYRKYNITSVTSPDDYTSLREVVYRRYRHLIQKKEALPDLIIADGGKGQMGVIKHEISSQLDLHIPVMGLAKNDKHKTDEILFGDPPMRIGIKQTDRLFHFLSEIQEEVHRYAISFHRQKRSKQQISSELDQIKGVGKSTKEKLLKAHKSIKRIKELSISELTKTVGKSKATLIYNYFRM